MTPFDSWTSARHGVKLVRVMSGVYDRVLALGDERVAAGIPVGVDSVTLPRLRYISNGGSRVAGALRFAATLVRMNARACWAVFRSGRDTRTVICFLGTYYTPVVLAARLAGKRVIVFEPTSAGDAARTEAAWPLRPVIGLTRLLNQRMASLLPVESARLIDSSGLAGRRNKVRVATLYVDTESFRLTTDIEARERVAGYAGRLVPGKGLEEILEAANISKGQGIRFRIIGDGPLRPWIERRLAAGDLPHVELCGWMNQDDLIEALNQMKLLILPSAAECLPNIVLEAMACGTPALATPVGGVPDLVEDEVTGFLLQPAIPEAIAARLSYALNHPRLATISKAARARVETEYSLVASTRRWRAIMGASWKN